MVGLTGHERAVDGGEREPRELVSDRAARVIAERDRYLCPQGQPLLPFRREYTAQKVEYRADAAPCNACPLKAQGTR